MHVPGTVLTADADSEFLCEEPIFQCPVKICILEGPSGGHGQLSFYQTATGTAVFLSRSSDSVDMPVGFHITHSSHVSIKDDYVIYGGLIRMFGTDYGRTITIKPDNPDDAGYIFELISDGVITYSGVDVNAQLDDNKIAHPAQPGAGDTVSNSNINVPQSHPPFDDTQSLQLPHEEDDIISNKSPSNPDVEDDQREFSDAASNKSYHTVQPPEFDENFRHNLDADDEQLTEDQEFDDAYDKSQVNSDGQRSPTPTINFNDDASTTPTGPITPPLSAEIQRVPDDASHAHAYLPQFPDPAEFDLSFRIDEVPNAERQLVLGELSEELLHLDDDVIVEEHFMGNGINGSALVAEQADQVIDVIDDPLDEDYSESKIYEFNVTVNRYDEEDYYHGNLVIRRTPEETLFLMADGIDELLFMFKITDTVDVDLTIDSIAYSGKMIYKGLEVHTTICIVPDDIDIIEQIVEIFTGEKMSM